MICYTIREGGEISRLPINCRHNLIIRQLKRNRFWLESQYGQSGWYSKLHLSRSEQNKSNQPWLVHSVFFIRNGKISRIWDSTYNGYRPMTRYRWSNRKVNPVVLQKISQVIAIKS